MFPACPTNGPGGAFDTCVAATVGCPPGQIRMRVLVRRPGGSWQGLGSICYDPTARPTAAPAAPAVDVAGATAAFFRSLPIPAPRPGFQPAGGTLVNLPTIFFADDQTLGPRGFDLGGLTVTVTPSPVRWTWAFEPGETVSTDRPGAPYPSRDVTHTYRSVGTQTVTVTATWTATYTVNGGPALPVAGTVTRHSAPLTVPVREARSELIAGDS